MRYLGYQKREISNKNRDEFAKEDVIDVYVFNNPGLFKYESGFVGVHPLDNPYKHFMKNGDGFFHEEEGKTLSGIGIHKNNLFNLDEVSFEDISKKSGISEHELERILD